MTIHKQTTSIVIRQDNLNISKDINSLVDQVIKHIVGCAHSAIEHNNIFHFSLAGGSTPKIVFEQLASPAYRNQIDWKKTHIWFGDERCVPPEHPDSNYRMARQALLDQIPIPDANIHRIPGEQEPEEAAQYYAKELTLSISDKNQNIPIFDLMLQGLGPDGHTASLFPDTPALEMNNRLTTAVYVKKFDSWRVSVTFPVLNAARNILFLVAGEAKKEIILDLLQEDNNTRTLYPVEMIIPAGSVQWYLDEAAASLIKS